MGMRNPIDELRSSAQDRAAPPPTLLPYQQRWVADPAPLKVCEKGRRVGMTWAEASDAVLGAAAAGGSNYFYISATQDMAREFVEACAMWARAFDVVAGEVEEGLYDDGVHADPAARWIKTYEVGFPKSGRRIVALSSRPANLRGKQGTIGIDEAAFAPELAGLLKAAMAMLMWGDRVRIWSTHDGVENPFSQLVTDVRAGKRGGAGKASVHKVDFDLAVQEGLFRRVCLRRGREWSPEAQDEWVADARRFYGDDAAEELDCIPSKSSGAYLSLALIEQRMTTAAPPQGPALIRQAWDDAFAYLPEDVRKHAIRGWLEEEVAPVLRTLRHDRRHAFGQDFARSLDLSVMVALEEDADIVRRPRLIIELTNCPFSSQQQVAEYVIGGLPRWQGAALDATGNGAALAEAVAQTFGVSMVEQIKMSEAFYLAQMPRLKSGLQDGTLTDLPRDDQIRDDLRSIQVIRGVPRVPDADTRSAQARAAAADAGAKRRRHGDVAIALLLALYAFTREGGEIDWHSAAGRDGLADGSDRRRLKARPDHSEDALFRADEGGDGAF